VGGDPVARPVTVAVVEDQPVTIAGIESWIERDPGGRARVIASGSSIDAVLAGPGGEADVLLLDLELEDGIVIDRIPELCADGRKVVVFSVHDSRETIAAVLDAGASEFLAKHESRDHCVDVIVAVAADRACPSPTVAGVILADSRPRLSEQERTALLLWFQGMPKASVARRMGISEATVRQYIARARVKYAAVGRHAGNQFALLARAISDGLISPDEVGGYGSHSVESPR
jgi:two-component system nitrate/nitrite response regulator NarL